MMVKQQRGSNQLQHNTIQGIQLHYTSLNINHTRYEKEIVKRDQNQNK